MSRLSRLVVMGVFLAIEASGALLAQGVRLRAQAPIYVDALGEGLREPEGVAYDGSSILAVADTGNRRILILTATGDQVLPTSEIRLPQIPYPTHVRFDSRGELLVLDGKSDRIVRLTADYKFKDFLETPGSEGKNRAPTRSFDLDGRDNVYILDVAGGRVAVLDSEGDLLREISFSPESSYLSDLTVSEGGVVYAVDTLNKQVFVARTGDEAFTPLGAPLAEDIAFPTAITSDGQGHLFIADKEGGSIVIVGQNGEFRGRQLAMGWKKGFLRQPSSLSIGGGLLYVADRANNRVQRFEIVY